MIFLQFEKVGYGEELEMKDDQTIFGTKSRVAFTGNSLGRRKTGEVQFRPDWTHTHIHKHTDTHTAARFSHTPECFGTHLSQAVNKLYWINDRHHLYSKVVLNSNGGSQILKFLQRIPAGQFCEMFRVSGTIMPCLPSLPKYNFYRWVSVMFYRKTFSHGVRLWFVHSFRMCTAYAQWSIYSPSAWGM